ncbi:ankyrin repeat domain-containing protein SOWAHA-like [Liolophura sinensis]|uniref:ankyrin repeat domain-containing protein SOWAHA-like n=1 Tax=Liolophura sinensis TaxID=3198878 RepID=UPI003158F000
MADDCDLESVRDFILSNGGKIRNADLVTRYRKFLDNPQSKAANREKFKDIVNTLATIKKDESGEKVLVLKKKFRTGSISASNLSKSSTDLARAQSEPPNQPPSPQVARAREGETDAMMRVKSEGNLGDSSGGSNPSVETVSASSLSTADSSMSAEEDEKDKENLANMSVKERAKHLNKIESQTQLEKAAGGGGRRKENKGTSDGDDDSHSGFVTIGPKEREWLLISSSADYHPMAKLLNHNPSLVRLRVSAKQQSLAHQTVELQFVTEQIAEL